MHLLPVITSSFGIRQESNSWVSGIKGKIFSSEKKDHFLDYAKNCDENIIQDWMKTIDVFSISFYFYSE